jgi:predicted dehydrogenase
MFGKLNMAILGTGNIAATMAKTMKSVSSVTSYAVASRDIGRAEKFARENGFKKAYGSYEELLQDRKVDLVYIATPHSEHYGNMKMAVSYGKPVLCEKSFTVNAAMAQEIFDLADEKNVFVTEAMWVRYMPMLDTIREVLASRVIGDAVMLTANLGYNIRQIPRMNDPELGGGALLDVGVYVLNFAAMMFGEDILKIEPVCTYSDKGLDEQESITIKYRDGRMAVLNASMIGISDRRGVIYGTKGFMVIDNINNFESLTVYDTAYRQIGFYKRPKQKTGYEYEVQACVKAIKSGWLESADMPHAQTLYILKLMDSIRSEWGIKYPCEIAYEQGSAQAVPGVQTAADTASVGAQDLRETAAAAAEEPSAPINVSAAPEETVPEVQTAADENVPEVPAAAEEQAPEEAVSKEEAVPEGETVLEEETVPEEEADLQAQAAPEVTSEQQDPGKNNE